jgi:GntR family phosphonate transport system transcriptional regulator
MTLLPSEDARTDLGGVALWRQIADQLRLAIATGAFEIGSRLPGETELAERFRVNRHTVRAALKVLERNGLVRARQGRGTFVLGNVEAPRRDVGIPNRALLPTGLAGEAVGARGQLLEAMVEPATAAVAAALWLHPDELVTRMEIMSVADGQPIVRATSWFSAERFPAIDGIYRELGSISETLKHHDIEGLVRASTRLSARHADTDEAKWLSLSPGAIVLVAEGVDVVPEGQPVHFSLSRFAAERVELVVLGE